jgi:formylglycine-generating enzyme required for sulfatase activity
MNFVDGHLGKEVNRRSEIPSKTPIIDKPAIPPKREQQKKPDLTPWYVVAIVAAVAVVVLLRSRGGVAEFQDCENCPRMVVIPSGSFVMGSPTDESGRDKWESPQHKVTIPKSLAVGKFAVTFAEWDACVAAGGCGGYVPEDRGWGRGERPVINVSWYNAKAYVAWLSKTSGASYRLLSEAEREYVARAGTATPYWWGSSIMHEQANFGEKSQMTLPVESFEPNPWGLYQVHGNVNEWVEDCWHDTYDGAPIDGSAWIRKECNARVLRGGSWWGVSQWLRAAWRGSHDPKNSNGINGFRVARTL